METTKLSSVLLIFLWMLAGVLMINAVGSTVMMLLQKDTQFGDNGIEIKTTGESYIAHYEVSVLHPQFSIPYKRRLIKKKLDLSDTDSLGKKYLSLHLVSEGRIAKQSIISEYSIVENRLVLVPRNTLGRNLQFAVRRKKRGVFGTQTVLFETPQFIPTDEPLSKIIQWYPSGDITPENTLVFYAVLDSPVLIDANSIQAMSIQDEFGHDIPQALSPAFLPSPASLQTIIPFLIHPGRVKRGVKLRELFGPVMKKGNAYTLTIQKTVGIDPYYRHLATTEKKLYRAGDFDTVLPQFYPHKSKIPQLDTYEPLQLAFSEAMDYVSVAQYISVYPTKKSKSIVQTIKEGAVPEKALEFQVSSMNKKGVALHRIKDSVWAFTPREKWEAGNYTVHISEYVKDLAHNSLDVPFEVSDVQVSGEGALGEGKSRFFEFELK